MWPIGAGSWALQNELQYLDDHPAVIDGVDRIVLVANSGDFAGPSCWANANTHPVRHLSSAAWQALTRYLLRPTRPPPPPQLGVPRVDVAARLRALTVRLRKPLLVVLYPSRDELRDGSPCGFAVPPVFRMEKLALLCLKRSRRWRADLYRDSIHPTPAGMRVLAGDIAVAL